MSRSPLHHRIAKALTGGLIGLMGLTLAGCGGNSGGPTTLSLAASLSEADVDGIVTINLTGLPADAGKIPVSAFTVFENGSARLVVSAEKIDENSTRAGADIAFVLDTTESMKSAIDSAKDSIQSFVDHLDAKGLDVRVGAVTFGDAFDTKSTSAVGVSLRGSAPPAFDVDERPSFPLGSRFVDFGAFLSQQRARSGGKPRENALGALEFAYGNLEWRAGAQRILIVVTDTCSYDATNYGEDGIIDPWIPRTQQQVLARLKGQAIVHVIAPKLVSGCPFLGYADMSAFTGATGTGGLHVEWDGKSEFSLAQLPLTPALTAGYLLRYTSNVSGQRNVRVAFDHGELHGEALVSVGGPQ